MENNFNLNQVGENIIQIYGSVVGIATKTKEKNASFWQYKFSFFKGTKQFQISNFNNRTIKTIEDLEQKITKIIEEAQS